MEKLFYLFGPLRAVVLVIENVLRQEGNVVVKQAGILTTILPGQLAR